MLQRCPDVLQTGRGVRKHSWCIVSGLKCMCISGRFPGLPGQWNRSLSFMDRGQCRTPSSSAGQQLYAAPACWATSTSVSAGSVLSALLSLCSSFRSLFCLCYSSRKTISLLLKCLKQDTVCGWCSFTVWSWSIQHHPVVSVPAHFLNAIFEADPVKLE